MKTSQKGALASIERLALIQMGIGAVLKLVWLGMRGGASNHASLYALGAGFFIAGFWTSHVASRARASERTSAAHPTAES